MNVSVTDRFPHTAMWKFQLLSPPPSFPMSLDFYAIRLNESLTVSLSLRSFPDLSLTAWELPAKTSNEILALMVVPGEEWKALFPHLFLLYVHNFQDSSLLQRTEASLLHSLCSFPPFLVIFPLSFDPSLSSFSLWISMAPHCHTVCLSSYVSAYCCSVSGWWTEVKLPLLLHMPTAGIWMQRRLSKFIAVYREQDTAAEIFLSHLR